MLMILLTQSSNTIGNVHDTERCRMLHCWSRTYSVKKNFYVRTSILSFCYLTHLPRLGDKSRCAHGRYFDGARPWDFLSLVWRTEILSRRLFYIVL